MSPAGGRAGRRLRGVASRPLEWSVSCTCGGDYFVLKSSVQWSRCPFCQKPTREL